MSKKRKKEVLVRKNPIIEKLKRGPQIILPKDFGSVVSHTGIGKKSKVVEAGTGSGFSAIMFANICKKVITYERNETFYNFSAKNIKKSGLKNIKQKQQDIREGIRERNIDLIFLDMPNSDEVIDHAYKALKNKGFLVSYVPNVEQMKTFYLKAEKKGFDMFANETIIREWKVRDYGVRPNNKALVHTAFLVFARKNETD